MRLIIRIFENLKMLYFDGCVTESVTESVTECVTECVTESVTENLLIEKASQSRRNVVFQKKNQWKKQQFSFKNMILRVIPAWENSSFFAKHRKALYELLMKSYEIFKEIPKGQK